MALPDLRKRNRSECILYSILFLFFFQLISDFIEAVYAFGLLSTGVPVEGISVLLIFSPVFLLFKKGLSRKGLIFIGELVLVCRVLEVMLDTRGRMIVSGIGVACFLILFPALLWGKKAEQGASRGLSLGMGLTFGLSLSILFRALNSGIDISTWSWFQPIGWLLAAVAGMLMFELPDREAGQERSGNTLRILGLSLGVISVFVLLYFAFTSPNVIARWTGVRYVLIVSILMLVLCVFVFLLLGQRLLAALTPGTVLIWNILFVLAMVLTVLSHQISFPVDVNAYPLSEPSVTWLHHVPLILMLLLFPILLIDFVFFTRALIEERPSLRALGGGFSMGAFFFLFTIFAQIFTTIYDYVPVAGPPFRDQFWFVFLIVGIVLTLSVLLVRQMAFVSDTALTGFGIPGAMVLIGLATVVGAFLTEASPTAQTGQAKTLKILTYNIQQGYSEVGLKNYDEQLDLIREVDADIIGLQECDTNRIAGGNSDVVKYFADKLNLYSYCGPKTVPGTFGIALLSRYPIENPETFYMYSIGEQTATIEAQISAGRSTFAVFVTHLGNGGPVVQQRQILERIKGKESIIALGDFNFRPDAEPYRLTTEMLDDSWLLRWPHGENVEGVNPSDRIDHIFVSPGTKIIDARYLVRPCSDHPAVTAEIEL